MIISIFFFMYLLFLINCIFFIFYITSDNQLDRNDAILFEMYLIAHGHRGKLNSCLQGFIYKRLFFIYLILLLNKKLKMQI